MNDLDALLSSWKQSVELSSFELERVESQILAEGPEPLSPAWWKSIFANAGDSIRFSNDLNSRFIPALKF